MNKRTLHHMLVSLRQVRAWHLGILLMALLGFTLLFLRQNNLDMITLRNLVVQADEQNGDVAKAMANLRNYIATHMNTGMGDRGIYLERSYQRAYLAAVDQAKTTGNHTAVFQLADHDCRAQNNPTTDFAAYAQCMTDKAILYGAGQDVISISPDLYRYNFIAPAWSADVAGFTLLATVLVGTLVVGRWVLLGVVYLLARSRL